MLTLRIVMSLLLLTGICFADDDEWTKTDTLLELAYGVIHVIDWKQTRYLADHPHDFEEHNPILGDNPSHNKVDLYFAGTMAAHVAISYILPKEYRKYWQMITIGIEGSCVARNFYSGVKVRF